MTDTLVNTMTGMNLITILLILTVAASVVQGALRGATGSAQTLLTFAAEGLITVVCVLGAWKAADTLSPVLRDWLMSRQIVIPNEEMGAGRQLYYTVVTGIRDFPLLRVGLLFLLAFAVIKPLLYVLWLQLGVTGRILHRLNRPQDTSVVSSGIGGLIGSVIGLGRALLLIAVLFVYTTLFPDSGFTEYVKASDLYMKGATQVIAPFSGEFLEKQLPVFTKAFEQEFKQILQRKYEVVDARIPDDIAEAAKQVTAGKSGDEAKARALYQWIGTRVQYDWEKVELYEREGIWKDQTPEETFATRKGVCIDYARLYAVMARSVGLDVKVVTGLGYDGRGGYGPHAWNEVYLKDKSAWIPLDSTWVSSGGNWFNPPDFDKTHIKDA